MTTADDIMLMRSSPVAFAANMALGMQPWQERAIERMSADARPRRQYDLLFGPGERLMLKIDIEATAAQMRADPISSLPLGGKIGIGALAFAGGLFYVTYAFRHGGRLKIHAGLGYLLLGMFGLLCGVAFGFYAIAGL